MTRSLRDYVMTRLLDQVLGTRERWTIWYHGNRKCPICGSETSKRRRRGDRRGAGVTFECINGNCPFIGVTFRFRKGSIHKVKVKLDTRARYTKT